MIKCGNTRWRPWDPSASRVVVITTRGRTDRRANLGELTWRAAMELQEELFLNANRQSCKATNLEEGCCRAAIYTIFSAC